MRFHGMGEARRWLGGSLLAIAGAGFAFGGGGDPWGDAIVSYDQGSNPLFGYTNPDTLVGAPERFTGETDFKGKYASAVTAFNSAFGSDEIVSIGAGGHVTVRFDEPITNDPGHLYGVDLILFGNGSFIDTDYPDGHVGGVFSEGPFAVSVSADGDTFEPIAQVSGDGIWPAEGYLDLATPYSEVPGQVESDFLKPLDPTLTLADFLDKSYDEVKAIYAGSGGGLPLDIAASGLSEVFYVRIDVPEGVVNAPEFDALAVVPEPGTAAGALLTAFYLALRRTAGKGGQQP